MFTAILMKSTPHGVGKVCASTSFSIFLDISRRRASFHGPGLKAVAV